MQRFICNSAVVACAMVVAAHWAAPGMAWANEPAVQLLWPAGAPGAVGEEDADKPKLTLYPAPGDSNTGAAVVICPGGGYGFLAMDHEGHQVAQWLNTLGINAYILSYRIAPRYHHPAPMQDVQRALRLVRSQAEAWHLDAHKIGVLGFSAGGHLASTAATHFDSGQAGAEDPMDRVSCRPDFAVLGYPVISFKQPFTHGGSRNNLIGDKPSEELINYYSNEEQVTPETPPTFLVHTTEDTAVPPQNSIVFYLALQKAGVPAELHIYEKGRHGLGLGGDDPAFATWPARCQDWFIARGILQGK